MEIGKYRFEFKQILTFKGIAAILIFGSWIIQNFLFNNFSGQARQLQTYSIKRDFELILSTTWWMKFVELKNNTNVTNSEKILTLINFLKYSNKLIEKDLDIIEDLKKKKLVEDGLNHHKKILNAHIEGFFDFSSLLEGSKPGDRIKLSVMDVKNDLIIDQTKNINNLATDVEKYMIWSEFAGKPIIEGLENKFNEIQNKEDKCNLIFLFLYIAGAIIGGLGFLHKGKKDNQCVQGTGG